MSAWIVDQWQVLRGRIAVGLIFVGAIANVVLLAAVAIGALYGVGSIIGLARAQFGPHYVADS